MDADSKSRLKLAAGTALMLYGVGRYKRGRRVETPSGIVIKTDKVGGTFAVLIGGFIAFQAYAELTPKSAPAQLLESEIDVP